jgi:hypothetical protein
MALTAVLNLDDAVLQQTEMFRIQKPSSRDLKTLQELMSSTNRGDATLAGIVDKVTWENPDRLDLLVLRARREDSLFSALLSDKFVYWFHQKVFYPLVSIIIKSSCRATFTYLPSYSHQVSLTSKNRPNPEPESRRLDDIAANTDTTHYSQTTLLRIVRVIAMAMSSLLPILAITVLYFIRSMKLRLAVVAAFTFGFSIVVGVLTHGDLINVFVASAAFAAVEVVFVGSVVSNSRCP